MYHGRDVAEGNLYNLEFSTSGIPAFDTTELSDTLMEEIWVCLDSLPNETTDSTFNFARIVTAEGLIPPSIFGTDITLDNMTHVHVLCRIGMPLRFRTLK